MGNRAGHVFGVEKDFPFAPGEAFGRSAVLLLQMAKGVDALLQQALRRGAFELDDELFDLDVKSTDDEMDVVGKDGARPDGDFCPREVPGEPTADRTGPGCR